jgi:hypothetical protein
MTNESDVEDANDANEPTVLHVIQPAHTESQVEELFRDVEDRLMHVMTIFPFVSASMLQTGIGPSLPPKMWRPVLHRMVSKGLVAATRLSAQTPAGRAMSYLIYHRADNSYLYNAQLRPQTLTVEQYTVEQADNEPQAATQTQTPQQTATTA